ncbi:MAG: hypothetical protein QXM08_02655 [Thermofilaceae archaeon]
MLGVYGLKYSDVVSVFYGVVAEAVEYAVRRGFAVDGVVVHVAPRLYRWFSGEVALAFASRRGCYAPYVHYGFEYPPLVGALWYASTCLAYTLVLPEEYTFEVLVERATALAVVHYLVHAAVLTASLALSAVVMVKLADELRIPRRRVFLYLLLPSTVLYAVYNWDALALLPALTSIYLHAKRRHFASGVLLGVATSAKLLPAFIGAVILAKLTGEVARGEARWRDALRFLTGCVLGGVPLLAWVVLYPQGFTWAVNHIGGWFCENCIYNLVLLNEYSPLHRVFFLVLAPTALLATCYLAYRGRAGLATSSSLAMLSATVLNYIFTPQMLIAVTPLLLLVLPSHQLLLVAAADVANALLIIVFFNRDWVELLGHREPISPFTPSSVVQLIANTRNVLLLITMIILYTQGSTVSKRD